MGDRIVILIARYEQAVRLYEHEDNLTWRKLQQAIYVNGAMATVVGIDLIEDERWILAAGATLLGVLFLISIESSRRYMFARLAALRAGERALCAEADVEPLIREVRPPRGVPGTTFAVRVFMWLTIVCWASLTVIWSVGG